MARPSLGRLRPHGTPARFAGSRLSTLRVGVTGSGATSSHQRGGRPHETFAKRTMLNMSLADGFHRFAGGDDVNDMVGRVLQTLQQEEAFLAALATVDSRGRPHVRYVRGRIDKDLTIRCPTFLDTEKVRQIARDPHVALTCGDTESTRPGSYYQIEGTARISLDPVDRRQAWNSQLEKWFSRPDHPGYAVVVIHPTRIEALPIGGGPAPQTWQTQSATQSATQPAT